MSIYSIMRFDVSETIGMVNIYIFLIFKQNLVYCQITFVLRPPSPIRTKQTTISYGLFRSWCKVDSISKSFSCNDHSFRPQHRSFCHQSIPVFISTAMIKVMDILFAICIIFHILIKSLIRFFITNTKSSRKLIC